jgi:integrase
VLSLLPNPLITQVTLVSFILGRISPRYKTVNEWAVIYRQLIDSRPISAKTKANRRGALVHVLAHLGKRVVSSVRPHEVAAMIQYLAKSQPQTAKRVLFECADMFNQAMNYGWIDRNPAISVKAPICRVQRKRLTFANWQDLRAHADENMPPWVANMMTLALITGQRRSDLVKMQFDDVWDNHLHIEQAKTGTRLALPLALKLDELGLTLAQVIAQCKNPTVPSPYLLRKNNGGRLADASLSARFEEARKAVLPSAQGIPASLHECRSLSERMYRTQGLNTMVLLGHKHQAMTDIYNDDRGLTKGTWKPLLLA